jgi:hypothetical protein
MLKAKRRRVKWRRFALGRGWPRAPQTLAKERKAEEERLPLAPGRKDCYIFSCISSIKRSFNSYLSSTKAGRPKTYAAIS